MRRLIPALVFLLAAGSMPAVFAAEVPDLYEAEVPVFGQERAERDTAMASAFVEVLVRVSGRGALAAAPGLAEELARAPRYVEQYRYRKRTPEEMAADPAGHEQVLWIRFNARAVDRLLRRYGLPAWGRTRPVTLVWLVVDDGGQRRLIANDARHPVRRLLEQAARRRGIPVRFPLWDLQDRARLQVSDVWANFEEPLLAASDRYQAEAVAAVRIYRGVGGGWQGRWSLYAAGRRHDWAFTGAEAAEVVGPGVDEVAEVLAARFARAEPELGEGEVTVLVRGVRTLADYDRVWRYLSGLGGVDQVQPVVLRPDRVLFRLRSRGGRLALTQAVALGDVLASPPPEPEPGATPAHANPAPAGPAPAAPLQADLVYRLIP